MKKIFLYTAFFSVVFFSCKKTTVDNTAEDKTYASSATINKNDTAYKEVFDVKKSSDYNEKNDKVSTVNFNQYSNNANYFIKTFDVNKDGIKDKIVSHNRYSGDELLIFLGDKNNNYIFTLKSTNFSEDGGNQVTDIKELNDGYEIVTQFPDRGYLEKSYLVSGKNNQFVLRKIKTESDSWQDNYRENCVQDINFNLKKSTKELYETISKTKPNCTKISGNQYKVKK